MQAPHTPRIIHFVQVGDMQDSFIFPQKARGKGEKSLEARGWKQRVGLARVRLQEKGSWGQLKLSIRFQAYFLEKKGEGDVELVKKRC